MSSKVDQMHDRLQEHRREQWHRPLGRVLTIVQAVGVRSAVRPALDRAHEFEAADTVEPSDALPGPLRYAWRTWISAWDETILPPLSDLLPIPEAGAEVWAEARRRWIDGGDVDAILQLSLLRAFREEHGPADRMGREHIRP